MKDHGIKIKIEIWDKAGVKIDAVIWQTYNPQVGGLRIVILTSKEESIQTVPHRCARVDWYDRVNRHVFYKNTGE